MQVKKTTQGIYYYSPERGDGEVHFLSQNFSNIIFYIGFGCANTFISSTLGVYSSMAYRKYITFSALGDLTFLPGEEVALYCAKYLPDIIKDQKAYKEGKLQKVCLPTMFTLHFCRLSLVFYFLAFPFSLIPSCFLKNPVPKISLFPLGPLRAALMIPRSLNYVLFIYTCLRLWGINHTLTCTSSL